MDPLSAPFWAALGSIIIANILLSGDNAVVIALAARSLPAHQQRRAIVWGSGAAIVMRIALTLLAAEMLQWPYLKLVGGALLLYIGVTLMLEEEDVEEGGPSQANSSMLAAIRTILIADLVMSLDNVLAVAAAAKGNTLLLIIGLAISIPLIVFGSTMLLKVMERFPIIIVLGAALLGYLGGEMMASDRGLHGWIGAVPPLGADIAGIVGAVAVVAVGLSLQRRARRANSASR